MRGANVVLQAVLMFAIVLAAIIVVLPWTSKVVEKSPETSEPEIVLGELKECNGKITETARTGNGNTCVFSIKAGALNVKQDGLYYFITSTSQKICDQHIEMLIDPLNHIYQRCDAFQNKRTLQYKWSWPSEIEIGGIGFGGDIGGSDIIFDPDLNFTTLTVYVEFDADPNQAGTTLEIVRKSITQEDVVIKAVLR